jgi:signal transduction histidine kinase
MRSLQRHLLGWILGALLAGGLALVGVSYLVTLEEMDEIFDENLKQVALAVASHHRFASGSGPQTRDALPALPRVYEQQDNFDFVTMTGTAEGRRTFVSEPGVTLPLLTVALRRGLKPLDQAADGVAARSAVSLEPIDAAPLPAEIHPLIRSINELMQRLSEAFSVQRRFIADAAHELRSPVTALRLQVQVLERAKDESSRARALADLKAGIERAQRLIEQLLRLSRVEPDAPARPLQPVDLGDAVRSAVSQQSVTADHKGVDLGADAAADLTAMADPRELEVLLDNLIGNAIRYTPPGGSVDVRASRIAGSPALQVIDTGPGIPEHERVRVFDRFYRSDGLRGDDGSAGSGLGLAIVERIARRNAAQVSLHTAPSGRGLEVRVVFG